MHATIAYYDPPRRPAARERPDFTALPLTREQVIISNMRAAGGGFSLDRERFTLASAPTEVRDLRLRGPRFSVFNVWRAFSGPPQDVPLALCDCRSVALRGLIRPRGPGRGR